ncbi:hypothetical protein PDESU_01052 [Pontiella desulfatans]|uniref:PEP-CTERM protein-sorting domain-containing protein n=2 Tax=Pontiella desulfatans TaxID=2750659 RepID=A0A6C2TY24_PONDE|nr:hypothetical protein PDESU_01052 [Pontiella desulfatans]
MKYITAGLCLVLGAGAYADAVLLSDSFDSSTVSADNGLRYDEMGTSGAVGSGAWQAASGTKWGIGGGSVTNASGGTNAQNEGALGRLVDISSLTDSSLNKINLAVNFATANQSETLYVHLRGYVAHATPAASRQFGNVGATNGNVWEQQYSSGTTVSIYNLNTGVEVLDSPQAGAGTAVQLSSGTSGAQSVDLTFDMSDYAVSDITGYDYLGVFISRNSAGVTPMATINDITVTAIPEPATLGLIAMVGTSILFVRRRLVI